MEAILWFVFGYAAHGIFSLVWKAGLGVRIMKIAEIRCLELFVRAEEQYYHAIALLDLTAKATGEEERMKATKNELSLQHREWQDTTAEILKAGMADYKGFVQWGTYKEAMQYLTEVKTNERFQRLLIDKSDKEDS